MLLLIWINLLAAGLPRTAISQTRGTQTTVLQIGPQTDLSSTPPTMFTEPIPSPTQQRTTPGRISLTRPKPPFSGDFVVKYYGNEFSTQELLVKLNMTSAPFDLLNICPTISYSCETVCPLGGNEAQERLTVKPCYCDKLCVVLGDCCFDYFLRCAADPILEHYDLRRTCAKTESEDFWHGYVVIGSCPADNPDKNLESLCNGKSSLLDLPVSDLETNVVYKNNFCARCNNVDKQAYWTFFANCNKNDISDDILNNRSLMLEFIVTNCKWSFKTPRGNNNDLKRCLAVETECPDSKYVQTEPLLPNLCSFYAFPVCNSVRRKNPHCEICRGVDISSFYCDCSPLIPTVGPLTGGSLLILFDFSSSSSHTVKVGNQRTVVKNKACANGFAFDPFRDRCIQLHMTKSANSTNETAGNFSCNGSGFVQIDITLVTLYPNGSLWIPLYKRMYNNHSFFINNSSLFVCMNLTRNYTETMTLASEDAKVTAQKIIIITYIGCAFSMMSLILILCIYAFVAELRTLPGKNLMSLSIAMLLFHIFFLLNGQTNRPKLCNTAAFLIHYFLLSSFCWMSVMAFDVAKTFASKGQTNRSFLAGRNKKLLTKYSIFAWTTPAFIVIISIILDKTGAVLIGYGNKFCWISNGKALLVIVGVPVAVILVFNFIALSLTLASIRKVQKSTQRVADQRQETSLPILYLKLSSALGFTWLLGFIVPFVKVEFLNYLFVILNSLQGFFIFLSFVANKRTLNKLKGFCKSRANSRAAKIAVSNSGDSKLNKTQSSNIEEQLITTTL